MLSFSLFLSSRISCNRIVNSSSPPCPSAFRLFSAPTVTYPQP